MDAWQISKGSKEFGSMKQSADLNCGSGWRREWKVDQNICKIWNWKRRLGSGHSEIFIVVKTCISLLVMIWTVVIIQLLHQMFAQLMGVSFCRYWTYAPRVYIKLEINLRFRLFSLHIDHFKHLLWKWPPMVTREKGIELAEKSDFVELSAAGKDRSMRGSRVNHSAWKGKYKKLQYTET